MLCNITFEELKEEALKLGFQDIGVTTPDVPEQDQHAFREWIDLGLHAKLKYMENEKRLFPRELFPGIKTILLFISYYKQPKVPFTKGRGLVASYARGRDYHSVHRKRLKQFIAFLEERSGQKEIARGFSDAFPLMEKALAAKAGLGFFGKNTLLIHRKYGTFTLLSGIMTSLEFPFTQGESSIHLPRCGQCQKCLDACPTKALTPYRLDASKCLSYHLIESKEEIPKEIQEQNPGFIFGCDICQDVCPHNQRKEVSEVAEFQETEGQGAFLDQERLLVLQEKPEKLYGTPLQRRGVEGLCYTYETLR